MRVAVHPICHRAIHASFTNTELAKMPPEPEGMRRDQNLSRFLDWIANKPPDFHVPTRGRQSRR